MKNSKWILIGMFVFMIGCGDEMPAENNYEPAAKKKVTKETTEITEKTSISVTVSENAEKIDFGLDELGDVPGNLFLVVSCVKELEEGEEERVVYTLFRPGIRAFNGQPDIQGHGKLCDLYASNWKPEENLPIWSADKTEGFCVEKLKKYYADRVKEGYSCAYRKTQPDFEFLAPQAE